MFDICYTDELKKDDYKINYYVGIEGQLRRMGCHKDSLHSMFDKNSYQNSIFVGGKLNDYISLELSSIRMKSLSMAHRNCSVKKIPVSNFESDTLSTSSTSLPADDDMGMCTNDMEDNLYKNVPILYYDELDTNFKTSSGMLSKKTIQSFNANLILSTPIFDTDIGKLDILHLIGYSRMRISYRNVIIMDGCDSEYLCSKSVSYSKRRSLFRKGVGAQYILNSHGIRFLILHEDTSAFKSLKYNKNRKSFSLKNSVILSLGVFYIFN
jgi:hypothetical protein